MKRPNTHSLPLGDCWTVHSVFLPRRTSFLGNDARSICKPCREDSLVDGDNAYTPSLACTKIISVYVMWLEW